VSRLEIANPETLELLVRSRELLQVEFRRPLRLEEAGRAACLSPFHYHRLFVRTFGETPHELLTRRRLEEAQRLLVETDLAVTEICGAVGYGSLGTFSTRFRERTGRSPTEYRGRARRFFPGWARPPGVFIPTCFLRHWARL
jgi:AraC-like DNA-binding protein